MRSAIKHLELWSLTDWREFFRPLEWNEMSEEERDEYCRERLEKAPPANAEPA